MRFALRVADRRGALVDALAEHLPRVGLAGALADADRVAVPCPVPGDAVVDGFTWEPRDADDPAWFPQGVACVRGGDVLLVSWYGVRRGLRTKGSRITVVDRTDPARPTYRHVLLVVPRRRLGRLTLSPVPVHAGGIAVVGDLLHVADTVAGVRVFRLADVLRVPPRRLDARLPWRGAGTRTLGHRPTGGWTAYGHDHVLPQALRLRPAVPGALRFSFLSVGDVDGEPSLVVGEYRRAGARPRLVRYRFDRETGLPAVDAAGRSRPVAVHEEAPVRMQGVAVHGPTWWLSASTGEGSAGDLHVGRPGAFRRHRGVLPTGPEDLDWAVPGEELWGVTEWPGRRWVFRVDPRPWSPSSQPRG